MSNPDLPSFLAGAGEGDITPYPIRSASRFYEHVDAPDKLLRLDGHNYDMHKIFPYFAHYLEDLETIYGIPTVHPKFVVGAEPLAPSAQALGLKPNNIDVLTVVDRVDGVPAEQVLEQETLDPSVVNEFDLLSQRMVAQLRDVYERGGFHCQDIYRYDQFVYDDSAAPGQQLVLVDVAPVGFAFHYPPDKRLAGSIPIMIAEVVSDMAEDVIKLEKKAGRELNAGSEIIDFVESIDSSGFHSMEETKLRIVRALEEQDTRLLEPIQNVEEGGVLSEDYRFDSSDYVDHVLEKGVDI